MLKICRSMSVASTLRWIVPGDGMSLGAVIGAGMGDGCGPADCAFAMPRPIAEAHQTQRRTLSNLLFGIAKPTPITVLKQVTTRRSTAHVGSIRYCLSM